MQQSNYLIINNKKSLSNICYVFCSSNGLLWNSRDEKYVVENDYYEFKNIARDKRISSCKKIIFIRDLTLSFYVNGINDNINDISKIIAFVKEETKGLSIIAVGVSAGAYLANVLGLFLNNVETVFGLGTIFNIREWDGRHSYKSNQILLQNEPSTNKSYFYNLYPIFKEKLPSLKTTFYYLYGSKNSYDIKIAEKTRSKIKSNNFIFLPIKSKDHGVRFSYHTIVALITTKKTLKSRNKAYSKKSLLIKLVGLKEFVHCVLLDLKYKVFKRRSKNA